MSQIISQKFQTVRRGSSSVAVTVVRLTSASDSAEVPNMAAASNCAVQLRRTGDPIAAVSQSDIDTVGLTGSRGDEILLVTLHTDPIPEPR